MRHCSFMGTVASTLTGSVPFDIDLIPDLSGKARALSQDNARCPRTTRAAGLSACARSATTCPRMAALRREQRVRTAARTANTALANAPVERPLDGAFCATPHRSVRTAARHALRRPTGAAAGDGVAARGWRLG